MCRLEELQAAEFHEWDVALGEFDLERPRMMRGAEQHRLVLQKRAAFAVFKHAVDDVARLVGLIAHGNEARALGGVAVAP